LWARYFFRFYACFRWSLCVF